MRRLAARAAVITLTLALTGLGAFGAYNYGSDYYLHRGFATLVQLPRAGTGRLLNVHFHSQALHRRADYLVYLPPHYSSAQRYPVYYLLHGMPGQPHVFVTIANMDIRLDNQISLGRARPMILVYPDGRIGGSVLSDSEWANTPSGHFESYVLEVMRNVDHHFAALANRRDRVIGGFSAGAYGAVNIALHHLRQFANVQSWSGYFTQTPTGVFAHASRATLADNSPLHEIRTLRGAFVAEPLRATLFVGRDDSSSAQQLPMVRAMLARGVHVRDRIYPGGHDWSVWYPRLDQMLDLASWATAHPPAPARGNRSPTAMQPPARAALSATHRSLPRAGPRSETRLLGALLLALISAALINLGFILQHRGHAQAMADGRPRLIDGFRNPTWLGGQAVGWLGFAGQIVAVALAPLTLVQAFAAGSLAISVPVAARVFGYRVRRDQLIAIALIAVCLGSLPVGFAGGHGHLQAGALLGAALVVSLAAIGLTVSGRATARAIAAGLFYGLADAAIKADAVGLRFHGGGALLSGWTILAAAGTFGGFLAFQGALRDGDAVQPLALMTALTAVTAVVLGVGAFGESMGTGTAATVGHAVAIAVVLACVRPLARAQQQLAGAQLAGAGGSTRRPATLRSAIGAVLACTGATLAGVVSCLAGVGLLYELRELRWLAVGPRIPDALPLLQLAGFDGQPLGRVVAAWLVAGAILGVALIRLPPPRRALGGGLIGAVLLLLASDASYALARNLRFGDVLLRRQPGLGAWVEALLFALACAAPQRIRGLRRLAIGPARRHTSQPSARPV